MALLLTGPPGIGKTTAIRAVASMLPNARLQGFFTQEIRTRGVRQGFELITFGGKRAVMAHVDRRGSPRVGKYGVDLGVVDSMSRDALAVRDDVDVYLVDEIGKMECLSPTFVEAIGKLLDGPRPLVATVGQRGGGLIAEVKRRRRCRAVGTDPGQPRWPARSRGRVAGRVRPDTRNALQPGEITG